MVVVYAEEPWHSWSLEEMRRVMRNGRSEIPAGEWHRMLLEALLQEGSLVVRDGHPCEERALTRFRPQR